MPRKVTAFADPNTGQVYKTAKEAAAVENKLDRKKLAALMKRIKSGKYWVPKVGEYVYTDTRISCDHGWDDVRGGLSTVSQRLHEHEWRRCELRVHRDRAARAWRELDTVFVPRSEGTDEAVRKKLLVPRPGLRTGWKSVRSARMALMTLEEFILAFKSSGERDDGASVSTAASRPRRA